MESKENRDMIRELSPQEMERASGGQGDTPCPPYDAYIYSQSGKCVNLYNGPSVNYSTNGSFQPSTKVRVLERAANDWYYVWVKGTRGYVKSEHLIRNYIW